MRSIRWLRTGATVHASARVHPSACLAPGAVVQARAYVGPGCVLGPNAVVGTGVSVGQGTSVGPNVTLQHCVIGARCTLHAGVHVGADGFGFLPGAPGGRDGADGDSPSAGSLHDRGLGIVLPGDSLPVKKPQLLQVILGQDVEVGAGSCIDRGSWRNTVVGDHTKLDNLVQVGHNVHIGVGVLLCAHVALGGSSTIGDYCILAGKAAVADHVTLATATRVAACAGVTTDVTVPGSTVGGFPAAPAKQWRREVAWVRRAASGVGARAPVVEEVDPPGA